MKRFLSLTALALIMGTVPALAADTATTPPVQHGVSPDASNAAKMPPSGNADQSGGAGEQNSAPPSSAAGSQSSDSGASNLQGSDQSSGAREQSSAPPKSSAAEQKPNPTVNQ
jgi:hypothetical protein